MENVFYSNQFDDESMKFSLDKIIEALEKGLFVDTTRNESKEKPAECAVQMRNEARELEKAYGLYYRQLKRIESLPFDEQLKELHLLFVDISNQYDPPMYSEEAHTYADELMSPTWGEERKEDPPFSSITFDTPVRDLEMAQAKMLYIYREILNQLRFYLRRKLNSQQKIIEKRVDTKKNLNKKNKNMLSKGRPTTDTEEIGEEQFLSIKLFNYAKAIKRRLDLVNKLQDEEKKLEKKCNHLSWVLNKINDESGEFVKLCGNLPYEEYSFLLESCGFEEEEMESLGSFVDMILNERKREEADDYYSTWLQHKTGKHYKSLLVLYILVHKIELEIEESSSLLESANYHPGKSKKERVGNIINMYGGGSYTDVHGNANVTLNITTGIKNEPDSGEEMMSPEEQVPEVVQEEHEEHEEELNLDAPMISLQQLLKQPWFAEVRSDERYDEAWTDAFVEALIQSEYGKDIARDWNNNSKFNKCTEIKGYVIGTLKVAGVVKDISNDKVAKSVALMSNYRTFSKYIGKGKLQPYVDWVKVYVVDNNTLTK